jgi:Pro-kumamolisin, activation domain
LPQAESLLHATYSRYQKKGTHQVVTRTLSYSLPAEIAEVVDVVAPTVRFPAGLAAKVTSGPLGIAPDGLRNLYNVGNARGSSPNNKQAALGFLQQYVVPSDVAVWTAAALNSLLLLDSRVFARECGPQTFFELFYTPNINDTFTIVGSNDAGNPGVEADLDAEYST